MNILRACLLQRTVLGLLLVALLLPTLAACANSPAARPQALRLAGIVVDGVRLARPGESGLVTVWRDAARLDASAGMELRFGDRVETGPWATAVIRYPSGSELMMRPGSSGRIGSLTEAVGEFFAKIRGRFAIETQFVRAGALGTQYLVRTAPGGTTTVIVFDGQVEVGSTVGAWPSMAVGPGMMVLAHPRAPEPAPANADEVARTREWVERVEKLVPAGATGVSAAKTIALTALIIGAGLAIAGSRDRDRTPPTTSPTRPDRTPANAPPPLAAPTGATPGSPQESSPQSLTCAAPVTLSWNAVANAGDYLVSLEVQPARTAVWRPVSSNTVGVTRTQTAAGLSGLHRWRVAARSGTTLGPASAWLHFSCTPFVLR